MTNSDTILAADPVLTTRRVGQIPPSVSTAERKITSRADPVYSDLVKKNTDAVLRTEASRASQ
jgi:hypothetical protein